MGNSPIISSNELPASSVIDRTYSVPYIVFILLVLGIEYREKLHQTMPKRRNNKHENHLEKEYGKS